MTFIRTDSDFISHGTRCAAWLYRPDTGDDVPVIVMAHGFGAQRNWGLPVYAEHFANNGMAVLLFDYRNFGDSDGNPRNFVHPKRHLQDWKAAVSHARAINGIDVNRIGLWGTSFSGGHVLVTAAEDQRIAAVIAQVPFVDAFDSAKNADIKQLKKLFAKAFKDVFSSRLGKPPVTIAITGQPGDKAYLTHEGWAEQYEMLIPEGAVWENKAPARGLFPMSCYRPVKKFSKINCPVLLMVAKQDLGIPYKTVAAAADKIANVTKIVYDCGHFGLYFDPLFEQALQTQTEFFTNIFKL